MRILLIYLACLPVLAQHTGANEGRQLFVKLCSACHGDNAKGGRGPDLTTGDWKHGGSDDDLERNITKGIEGTAMPGFPIPASDVRLIDSFLHSTGSKAIENLPGDPERGRSAFFGTLHCSSCHMFGGTGGILGPDLTGISKRSDPAAVRQAIVNPDAQQREGFDTVEVKTKQGVTIRGAAKHEDTFSIQVLDQKGKLHLLLKKDLAEVNHTHKSPMPAISERS